MITEGDKIEVISGKNKGTIGTVQVKTGNGWYHINPDDGFFNIKLRLVNIVPHRNSQIKTLGQKSGIRKDAIFNKKLTVIKNQLNQHEKNIKMLSMLRPGPEYRKLLNKSKANERQIRNLSLIELFDTHRRVKKRTKRRLSLIKE